MTAVTWGAAIAAYSEFQLEIAIAESSVATRRQQLGRIGRTIGVPDPWQVTGPQLRAYLLAQSWQSETKRSRRTTLRGFYRWGVERSYIAASPAASLPRIKPAPVTPSPIPETVYRPALHAAAARERLILRLAHDEGLRRCEIAVGHSRDLLRDLTGWSLLVHGKGSKERVVPLVDDLAASLRALPAGWFFPGGDRGHLSPRWVGRLINRDLPDGWTIHKLRHRAGTNWYEQSADMRLVADLLGHVDTKTTMIYTKVDDGRRRAVVNAAAA